MNQKDIDLIKKLIIAAESYCLSQDEKEDANYIINRSKSCELEPTQRRTARHLIRQYEKNKYLAIKITQKAGKRDKIHIDRQKHQFYTH